MTALYFADTYLLIYARDPRRDPVKHQRARQWLEQLWRDRSGRLSTQVLNECYAVVTQKLTPALSPDEAQIEIRTLLCLAPARLRHRHDRAGLAGARALSLQRAGRAHRRRRPAQRLWPIADGRSPGGPEPGGFGRRQSVCVLNRHAGCLVGRDRDAKRTARWAMPA